MKSISVTPRQLAGADRVVDISDILMVNKEPKRVILPLLVHIHIYHRELEVLEICPEKVVGIHTGISTRRSIYQPRSPLAQRNTSEVTPNFLPITHS